MIFAIIIRGINAKKALGNKPIDIATIEGTRQTIIDLATPIVKTEKNNIELIIVEMMNLFFKKKGVKIASAKKIPRKKVLTITFFLCKSSFIKTSNYLCN